MSKSRGIPIVPIFPLKRRSDGEIVYASSEIPYKNGDQMQRYKHGARVILRNSIYGNYLLRGSCSNRGTCDRKLEAKK